MTRHRTGRSGAVQWGVVSAFLLAGGVLGGCIRTSGEGRRIFIVPSHGPSPATTADSPMIDWRPFGEVLKAHVTNAGRVDYFHIAQPPIYPVLQDLYAQLAAVGPESQPAVFADRNTKLAHYINAHNLLAILALAPYFGPGTIDPRRVGDLHVRPEAGVVFVLDGVRVTLEQIRRERIVPLLESDPRPLLALAAGRRNDPPLRPELYEPDRLDRQLTGQVVRVLSGPPWCEIDHDSRRVRLPAGIAEHREYYWARYLGKPDRRREGVQFITVLMDHADPRGRAWLNRALGYDVVTAEPADKFNNQPLFRTLDD